MKNLEQLVEETKKGYGRVFIVNAWVPDLSTARIRDLLQQHEKDFLIVTVECRGNENDDSYYPFNQMFVDLNITGLTNTIQNKKSLVRKLTDVVRNVALDWIEAIPWAGNIIAATIRTFQASQKAFWKKPSPDENQTPKDPRQVYEIEFRKLAERMPIILFLNNLQWADSSSIHLINALYTSLRTNPFPFLLIGVFDPQYGARSIVTALRILEEGSTPHSASLPSPMPLIPIPLPALNPVGRDREVSQVLELLKSRTSVVITGIAGIGKTTVMSHALRKIGAIVNGLYTDICFHLIAERGNEEERLKRLLLNLISSLSPQADVISAELRDLFDQAQRMVVGRSVLLAIDNADDPESHHVVLKMLENLPQVTLVVASRRAVWQHLAKVSLEGLSDLSGVKLFEETSGSTFEDKDKQVIASLCKQIHGHPMRIVQIALEVKERELSPQTLAANPPKYIGRELVQRFDSLYDRLPDSCQITLAVIGNLDTATLRVDLIKQVAQISMKDLQLLEDQHLIHFHLDRHRFTVHELVRGWCQDKLDNLDDDLRKKEFLKQLQSRIAEFYCQLLKKHRSGKPEDLREIDAEWPNILGLVDKISNPHLVLTLVDETIGDHFDDPNGYVPRRKQMILLLARSERLLRFANEVEGGLGARIEKNLGHFYYWCGNHEKAEELFLRSRDRYRIEGDIVGEIATTWLLGYLADDENRYLEAQALYERGTELAGQVKPYDKELIAVCHHLIGCTLYHQGRFEDAEREFWRARALINQEISPHLFARNERRLGSVALELGRLVEAGKIFCCTAKLVKRLERPRDAARIARHRGVLHLKRGRLDKAAKLLEQALIGFRELHAERGIGYTLHGQAVLHRKEGDLKKAKQLCEESLAIAIKAGSLYGEAAAYEEMANILETESAAEKVINRLRQRACNIYTVIGHHRAQTIMNHLKEVGAMNAQLPKELRGKLRGVLFDLMDTLAHLNPRLYETTHQNFAERLGVSWERFQWAWTSSRERASTGSFKATRDRIRWVANELDVTWRDESQYLDMANQEEMMWRNGVTLYNETITILQTLRSMGLRLAIVSNGPVAMACLSESLGLSSLVDAFILSSEVGSTKPNPLIYKRALESLGLEPSQCIFIGDGNDRELTGARELGMYTIKIKRPQAPYVNLEAASLDWDIEVSDLESIETLIEALLRSEAEDDTL